MADEGLISLANQCGITLKEMSSQVIQLGPVATVVVIGNVAEPPLPLPIPDYLFNDDANDDASDSTNTTGKKQSANQASTSNKLPVNSNVKSIHRRYKSRGGVAAPPGFAYNARDVLYNLSTHKACSKNRGFIEPLSQWTQKPDGTLYATCDRHR
ncbi:hypothetical protein B0O99DRAFT_744540 [Bisporella sp. PMI_857]|nr:hypothetical protein B0O99DRAFT_744540 [Bisporella sp. PMI_857]